MWFLLLLLNCVTYITYLWHGGMVPNTVLYNRLSDYIIRFWILRFAFAWSSIRTISLNLRLLTTIVAPQTKRAWSTCLPDTSVFPLERLFSKQDFHFRYNIQDRLFYGSGRIFLPVFELIFLWAYKRPFFYCSVCSRVVVSLTYMFFVYYEK